MQKALLYVFFLLFFLGSPVTAHSGKKEHLPLHPVELPFKAGEKLTYDISWSNMVQAGTAVMEIKKEQRPNGKATYRITSKARSAGLVSKFYKVSDTVESVINSGNLCSLSFRLDQKHGKRKKKREMIFNHEEGTVSINTDGQQATYAIPADVQDPLSSLYYVRTRSDFSIDKPIIINVHEDKKTWAVEVHTMGREKIKTSLGEFNTIKIKTYPRYDGVFENKGEIYIWLTDDARKIPVLMKSTITIGTIVSTLVEIQDGEETK